MKLIQTIDTRWTAVGWPYKIEQQMEQTEAQLEEDEERFRKLQLQDQANFNDRLDTLFVSTVNTLLKATPIIEASLQL